MARCQHAKYSYFSADLRYDICDAEKVVAGLCWEKKTVGILSRLLLWMVLWRRRATVLLEQPRLFDYDTTLLLWVVLLQRAAPLIHPPNEASFNVRNMRLLIGSYELGGRTCCPLAQRPMLLAHPIVIIQTCER